jgi:hypothetical protein
MALQTAWHSHPVQRCPPSVDLAAVSGDLLNASAQEPTADDVVNKRTDINKLAGLREDRKKH